MRNIYMLLVAGLALVSFGFYEAHVAKTHEPRNHDYNHVTILAYYYITAKCILNIMSGLYAFLVYKLIRHDSTSIPECDVFLYVCHVVFMVGAEILYFGSYTIILPFRILLVIECGLGLVVMFSGLGAMCTPMAPNPNPSIVTPTVV